MTKFLITFPAAAMVVPAEEMAAVDCDAHAVIAHAKAEGVYVFAGGIDGSVPPVRVSADGAVMQGGYPSARPLDGGFAVLELPSHEAAVSWAARFARACRCDQEVRAFGFDPAT
ncbi:MAG: transcription initiation protein [Pseudomonadota bacterium]